MIRVLQPPCSTEIDDSNTPLYGFRYPGTRLLVRCCQKEDVDAVPVQELPAEGLNLVAFSCGELRMQIGEPAISCSARLLGSAKEEQVAFGKSRVTEENAGKLSAGISANTRNSDAKSRLTNGMTSP